MDIIIPGVNDWHPLMDDYSDAQHVRKPHGIVFYNGKEAASTLQCPHCGAHFVPRKGEYRRRCLKHGDLVCDDPICNTYCVDYYATTEHGSTREL